MKTERAGGGPSESVSGTSKTSTAGAESRTAAGRRRFRATTSTAGAGALRLVRNDGRHDEARKIPGLTAKILAVVPRMLAEGMNVRFNTVIKDDNLEQILPVVEHAAALGAGVNLSVYTDFKNGNTAHLIRDEQHARVQTLPARHRPAAA